MSQTTNKIIFPCFTFFVIYIYIAWRMVSLFSFNQETVVFHKQQAGGMVVIKGHAITTENKEHETHNATMPFLFLPARMLGNNLT